MPKGHFAYSLGVFDNFQVGLEIPIIWTGGGILDPFIYQWHDFFSLPQGPRDEGSDDEFIIQGRNRDGTTFNIAESGTVIGDLVLSGKMLLTGGDDVMPAVSLSEQIRLPSGEEPYSQDAFDNVFSILASKRWYRWTAYLGAGYIFIGDDEENNLSFYQHRGSGFSTIEYFLSNQWTVFTTFQYSSALVKDVERFPDYELYWDIGSKYLFSDKIMLELMFRENPAPDRGTCDITFFAGVTVY